MVDKKPEQPSQPENLLIPGVGDVLSSKGAARMRTLANREGQLLAEIQKIADANKNTFGKGMRSHGRR